MELLKKIYHKYADTKLFRILGDVYRKGFFLSNLASYLRLRKIVKQTYRNGEPIRVIFLCQYTQAWNKLKCVYERMREDDRFEPMIVAVPYDIKKKDDSIYNYFYNLYGDNVIDAREDGRWFELELLDAQYVFYQRPYDQYLPKEYRSNVVSRYAKVCHVVYGYQLAVTTENSVMNKLFFRNVYLYFAENSIYHKYNIERFKRSHEKGYRRTLNIGYPSLEDFVNQKTSRNEEDRKFKVLWTPRWSEDKEVGGSNFINFKDQVVQLPEGHENMQIIFRPHPMTFQHFISIGRITETQVKDYLALYESNPQLVYDNQPNYAKPFWDCDVLLTDVSSIIAEWFLTEKPVIYCVTGSQPNAFMQEMMKVFYVVKTWEEAEAKVKELYRGIDPLKEDRKKMVKKLMGSDLEHTSNRFLDTMYDDYMKQVKK